MEPRIAEAPPAAADRRTGAGGIVRYLTCATLARSADGGAGLGLVLVAFGATRLSDPGRCGGLLVAALTAPHLAGPLVARRLDLARDGRRLLAAAFACYAVALACAGLLLAGGAVLASAGCAAVAGLAGPLLTGGLSSRLTDIGAGSGTRTRQAQGWDAMSYGLGGTLGPAAVAAVAAVSSPVTAVWCLAAAAAVAAVLTLTLPPDTTTRPVGSALPVRAALRLLASSGPLRRVTYATMLTAMTGGAFGLLAVRLGGDLSAWRSAGAVLAASFGLGNLLGSVAVTVRPLRGEPERLTVRHVAVMAVTYGCCAVAPTYPLAVLAGALAGASNAPFFTATLAARAQYAPPEARAQVFVSVAGLKIAAAAGGTALAGALLGHGPRLLLAGGAVLTAGAALLAVLDRRVSRS